MQLTTLFDMTPGGSGPWNGSATVTSDTDTVEFDNLVTSLLPCRTGDPELWFAEHAAQLEAAKAACRTCPLIDGCLAGAKARREPWGVWGGEIFVDGVVVARKRGRGRPSKAETLARQAEEAAREAAVA